jgi:hypothetical protein
MTWRRYMGKRSHRLTAAEQAESARLREAVQRAGLSLDALVRATGAPRGVITDWLARRRDLIPAHQRLLRQAYSAETGGPG